MATSTILLVLASAMAHASWNAILKRSKSPEDAIIGMMLVGGLASAVLALALCVPAPPRAAIVWSLGAGVAETVYFVTLARALSRAPLGPVYTIVRGGALVIVWPVSVALLGEKITLTSILGTLLVLLGLAATGSSERRATSLDHATVRSGLVVAATSALFVGTYHLAYKVALSHGGSAGAVNAISLLSGAVLNALVRWPRRKRALAAVAAAPALTLLAGLLGSGGFWLFLMAMRDAGAGAVMTLRTTSILFAQVLAFAMRDPPKRLGIVGAVLVTIGAVLLSR